MKLTDPVGKIKGVGEKTSALFEKLDIYTVEDLIMHYPRGYEVMELPTPIAQVKVGEVTSIEASIQSMVEVRRIRNLQIVTCNVQDASGMIKLTWFRQTYLKNVLKRGVHYIFRGQIVRKNGILTMQQPKIYSKDEYRTLLNVLQPIYPLTEGLTNKMVQKAATQALALAELPEDYLPARIRKENKLLEQGKALQEMHFPKGKDTMKEARERLVFDEFFCFTLNLRRIKENRKVEKNAFTMEEKAECRDFVDQLPFSLTDGQKKVMEDIRKDLTGEYVMNRLLQGDVGSGKTVVAEYAMLFAALNGYQASIMVPTEVLAVQHYEEMAKRLSVYGVNVCLLVGSMTQKEKKNAYAQIAAHEVDIIVGTHALIQEKVQYDKLALVVTDEQHRFGVRQREKLAGKGTMPHILAMSATPIPRTLAIMLYGDLDISILNELPAERLPIKNCVVGTGYRPTAFRFLEKQVAEGHQAYVICPMVEESEEIEAENVTEYAQKLEEALQPGIQVEILHGKMKGAQKNEIMERFSKGEIDILVSTTVVEVGVNVPNATVMMIENAERFGLAQLHQLRGRVGRGSAQSYCIMINGAEDEKSMQRLDIMNKSNDGFFIAQEDLKLRGPGDVFGIRQSGELEFALADIYQDADLLRRAHEAVESLTDDEYLHLRLPGKASRMNMSQ